MVQVDLIAAFLSIVLGILSIKLYSSIFPKLRRILLKKAGQSEVEISSGQKIQESIDKLKKTSKEVDSVIKEIIANLQKGEQVLRELSSQNTSLVAQKEDFQKQIETLQDVPAEVTQYFDKINSQTFAEIDKSNTRRDIVMFVIGIIVSMVATIGLNLLWMEKFTQ